MSAEILSCKVAVIGAGPAGLAAAQAAAGAGASVLCLDLFPAPGGQYAMQPGQPDSRFAQSAAVRMGRAAAAAAEAAGVCFVTGAELFWAAREGEGFRLSVQREGQALSIRAEAVVAATGAMERPLPFPGWTLPGVIAAGAAQRLLKTGSGRLPVPGKVVLAGSGAFLVAVAQSFARAGQPLDHFVEMRRADPIGAARLMLRHPGRIGEAAGLLAGLATCGARRHFGAIVTRALGERQLEAVEIAPLDGLGQPDLARAQVIEGVGTLAVGYGFQPVIDLTAALGAEHAFSAPLGGWYCEVDDVGATSVTGLFAAGEVTGLGGARPAILSGRLAGLAAARAMGYAAPSDTATQADLVRARAFVADLVALYPPPARLPLDLPDDEIVCRCEDVRLRDIQTAIAEGASEMLAVKLWTRAGMGPCQGRICGAALTAALAQAGVSATAAGFNRSHLPLRPVPLAVVRAAMARQAACQEEIR